MFFFIISLFTLVRSTNKIFHVFALANHDDNDKACEARKHYIFSKYQGEYIEEYKAKDNTKPKNNDEISDLEDFLCKVYGYMFIDINFKMCRQKKDVKKISNFHSFCKNIFLKNRQGSYTKDSERQLLDEDELNDLSIEQRFFYDLAKGLELILAYLNINSKLDTTEVKRELNIHLYKDLTKRYIEEYHSDINLTGAHYTVINYSRPEYPLCNLTDHFEEILQKVKNCAIHDYIIFFDLSYPTSIFTNLKDQPKTTLERSEAFFRYDASVAKAIGVDFKALDRFVGRIILKVPYGFKHYEDQLKALDTINPPEITKTMVEAYMGFGEQQIERVFEFLLNFTNRSIIVKYDLYDNFVELGEKHGVTVESADTKKIK